MRIQKLNVTPSKTPDESGNYNHLRRVTYRLGISIRCFSLKYGLKPLDIPNTPTLYYPQPEPRGVPFTPSIL